MTKLLDIIFTDIGISESLISNLLVEELDFEIFHFSDAIKAEFNSNDRKDKEILEFKKNGTLLSPDWIGKFVIKNLTNSNKINLIKGFPYLSNEFSALQEIIKKRNIILNKVWYFKQRNSEEFTKEYFEYPPNKKHLIKYGEEIIETWSNKLEERKRNIQRIKETNSKVLWSEIELDFEYRLHLNNIRELIKLEVRLKNKN